MDWHFNRGVETVGPVSPVGHGHLRSDSNIVLLVQMSERALEYLNVILVISQLVLALQ